MRQQIVGAIGAGATIEAAARFVGVAPSMIYDRKAKEPDFGVQCDEARSNEVARLAMTAVFCARRAGTKEAQPGDHTMLIFCLKNFDPVHWRDRKELEVSIPDIPGRLREAAERARGRLLSVVKAEAVTCEIVPFVPAPIGGNGGNGYG